MQAPKNVFFAICNGCFWCASLLGARFVDSCPSCSQALIEILPLASNERYVFGYDVATGVTLEFSPKVRGANAA